MPELLSYSSLIASSVFASFLLSITNILTKNGHQFVCVWDSVLKLRTIESISN